MGPVIVPRGKLLHGVILAKAVRESGDPAGHNAAVPACQPSGRGASAKLSKCHGIQATSHHGSNIIKTGGPALVSTILSPTNPAFSWLAERACCPPRDR